MASTSSKLDPQAPNRDGGPIGGSSRAGTFARQPAMGGAGGGGGTDLTYADIANPPVDLMGRPIDMLGLIGEADRFAKDYMLRTVEQPLARAYRAWQGQHPEGSKYLDKAAWRGRSRLFVPKTRSAVRKAKAAAAAAMFSTEDVINVTAEMEDDPVQRATAAVIKACVDYRLTRSHPRTGVPWFRIAMGASLDSQLTGVCISKQAWSFQEVEVPGRFEVMEVPVIDEETGEPLTDEEGRPVVAEAEIPVKRVTVDKPTVELFPIENAGIDPAAPWYDPVQGGRFFFMRHPMGLSDCRAWLRAGRAQGLFEVSDALLLKGRIDDDRQGVRYAREGAGADRYEDGKAPGELDIVWVQENFLRIAGIDWHWWSIGRYGYLSKVRETHESYPELDGERPYVMGVSQIDSHRVFPQSPVESWQPLQLEINDITNLRLDTLKRAIAPLPIVKRGGNVDLVALQRRGQPEAILMADNPTDITFASTPAPPGQGYTESSVANASFDELAGVFSTSSVQTSRQLNETVGGMRLMAGSANAVGEYDLRTWIESWAEPALRQVAHMVRYHESDPKILAVAGAKARVWQRFGYVPQFSDFDRADIWLRINVGIGNADPMQSLAKLRMAAEMMAPLFPVMQQQGIAPDVEAFIEEVFGKAGFRDGRRFFKFGQQPQGGEGGEGSPEMAKLMQQMQIAQGEMQLERERIGLERERMGLEAQDMQQRWRQFLLEMQAEGKEQAAERALKLHLDDRKGRREMAKQLITVASSRQQRAEDRVHTDHATREERMHALASRREDRAFGAASRHGERKYAEQRQREDSAERRREGVRDYLFGSVSGAGAPSAKAPSNPKRRRGGAEVRPA
jgi:hypothetical protein